MMKNLIIKKNIKTVETSALPCSCYGSCSWDAPRAKKINVSIKRLYEQSVMAQKINQRAS